MQQNENARSEGAGEGGRGVGGALEKYKRNGIARNRIKLSMTTTAKRLKLLVGLISIRK